MNVQEFLNVGGTIDISVTKFGSTVIAHYLNKFLARTYKGVATSKDTRYSMNELAGIAVTECMINRYEQLRAEQTYRIHKGISSELPTDKFTGHIGLTKIG